MLELFLPWFLTTCISGILGNRADAKFVSITQKISKQVKVGKIVNPDMQKALNRSFLLDALPILFTHAFFSLTSTSLRSPLVS
jgi:hypothetical protein